MTCVFVVTEVMVVVISVLSSSRWESGVCCWMTCSNRSPRNPRRGLGPVSILCSITLSFPDTVLAQGYRHIRGGPSTVVIKQINFEIPLAWGQFFPHALNNYIALDKLLHPSEPQHPIYKIAVVVLNPPPRPRLWRAQ